MYSHFTEALAAERRRDLMAQAAMARAVAPARRRRRRAWLACALPLALAAVALPAQADASVAIVAGNSLNVLADAGLVTPVENNRVTLNQLADGRLQVLDSGNRLVASTGCVSLSSSLAVCSGANQVFVRLGNGPDSLSNATSLPTSFFGGSGDDLLSTGGQPGPSNVRFSGESGRDTVPYGGATRGVNVLTNGVTLSGRPGDRDTISADTQMLFGSQFADKLTGDAGNEQFFGLGGDDVLSDGAGLDTFTMLNQADGADVIFGGPDSDSVEYNDRTRAITVTLDGGADDGEAGERDDLRQIERVSTGSGNDTLRAVPTSTAGVTFASGLGTDTITGSDAADTILAFGGGRDTIDARGGDDFVSTRDSEADSVACGQGTDTVNADSPSLDLQAGCERQQSVGVLRLGSRPESARAGATTRMQVAWTHPEASGRLAKVSVQVRDGRPVGEILIRPRAQRITAEGAIALVRPAGRLSRRGKTVTAQLAVRLDPSLAGARLALDIEATDTAGRRQIERAAGVIRVAG